MFSRPKSQHESFKKMKIRQLADCMPSNWDKMLSPIRQAEYANKND